MFLAFKLQKIHNMCIGFYKSSRVYMEWKMCLEHKLYNPHAPCWLVLYHDSLSFKIDQFTETPFWTFNSLRSQEPPWGFFNTFFVSYICINVLLLFLVNRYLILLHALYLGWKKQVLPNILVLMLMIIVTRYIIQKSSSLVLHFFNL